MPSRVGVLVVPGPTHCMVFIFACVVGICVFHFVCVTKRYIPEHVSFSVDHCLLHLKVCLIRALRVGVPIHSSFISAREKWFIQFITLHFFGTENYPLKHFPFSTFSIFAAIFALIYFLRERYYKLGLTK